MIPNQTRTVRERKPPPRPQSQRG